MRVKLTPLEFTDCMLDSPDFRENLGKHEKELEKSSQQIKQIIKEVKDVLAAAKQLSKAKRMLSKSLEEFNFECIGSTQTDDEHMIAGSLKHLAKLISQIEDERDRLLDTAHDQIVGPLEEFRKNHIAGVKEGRKKYDKKTARFCQAQERFLGMSTKKPGNIVVEADASLGMIEREYLHESLSYVLRIQDVQERIKFEFVELLVQYMSSWLLFYHVGHDLCEDSKEYLDDLKYSIQKIRDNFNTARLKAEELKGKYMDAKIKPESDLTKQGYLFLMEKRAFTVTWSKYYCTYKKHTKKFSMLQFNQISGKSQSSADILTLESCTKQVADFEKRFCFDLVFHEKPGMIFTFQALNEDDRKAWLSAMDGKEPECPHPSSRPKGGEYYLDDVGFVFIKKCIEVLEDRGLEEEGIYRVGGVSTKVTKLLHLGLDRNKSEHERVKMFTDEINKDLLETKTIASALKHYLRNLNEPLLTYRLYNDFISAAKQMTREQRVSDVHNLIYQLPEIHQRMLDLVVNHLTRVVKKSHINKMSIFNLGVIFGPTLLRASEETVAVILDIKFNNVVIEILIENYDTIFRQLPGASDFIASPFSQAPPLQAVASTSSIVYKQHDKDGLLPYSQLYAASKVQPVNSSLQNLSTASMHTSGASGGGNSLHDLRHRQSSKASASALALDQPSSHWEARDDTEVQPVSYNFGRPTPPNMHVPPYASLQNKRHESDMGSHRSIPIVSKELTTVRSELAHINLHPDMKSSSDESICSASSNRDPYYVNKRALASTAANIKQSDKVKEIFPKKNQRHQKGNYANTFHYTKDNTRVRTLYACLAENDGELSFEPNQIITNVRPSNEPGWLEGTLNGKSGLIPENYVELLP